MHEAQEEFDYGDGDGVIRLSVTVPVHACGSCQFHFTDDVADERRHDAICRHRGVLTPSEVRGVRERYEHSCEEFAALTGLGVASLRRWESGALIQSQANDNFLRLLLDPACFESLARMRRRATLMSGSASDTVAKEDDRDTAALVRDLLRELDSIRALLQRVASVVAAANRRDDEPATRSSASDSLRAPEVSPDTYIVIHQPTRTIH